MVVYSGDGDLFAIGGNHFIHAARRNMDLKVICVNNLTYAMTGGQTAPTTPSKVISATAPYGVFEPAFNLVALAEAAGASYVARWTTFHVKQLSRSMEEILHKKGFCFIEVLVALPHALPAAQQDGRRPRCHEVLQGRQQDPQRRSHGRMSLFHDRRNRRRQVCGPRASRLPGGAARADGDRWESGLRIPSRYARAGAEKRVNDGQAYGNSNCRFWWAGGDPGGGGDR